MPTVLRFHGLRVVIYPNDHRPAHVHVMGKGCEAVFRLNPPSGPPDLRENYGFSERDLAMIATEIGQEVAKLYEQWRVIHGY
jgi:hypothetical protein